MNVTICNSFVGGCVTAPPSKSYTHRAILAAGHSKSTTIENPLLSADTLATIRAIKAFGSEVKEGEKIRINGFYDRPIIPDDTIDCANSGTTMRLMMSTAALVDGSTTLTGDESLKSRPQGNLIDAINQLGGDARSSNDDGKAPVVIKGPINGGSVSIPGDVSSQFITSLLMAGGVTENGIGVEITSELKSKPYVDITTDILDAFGIEIEATQSGYYVPGGQVYEAKKSVYKIPGDFSSMSYLLAAGALASEEGIEIKSAQKSSQGDAAIIDILSDMGAEIEWDIKNETIKIAKSDLSGIKVDVGDTPDLLPTIAVLGAVAKGETRIVNCSHVRYKETDRVAAMSEELQKLGVVTKEKHDELIIEGTTAPIYGKELDGRGDHRIVMSLSILGLVSSGETLINGSEHVGVSYPDFFQVLKSLGAEIKGDQ